MKNTKPQNNSYYVNPGYYNYSAAKQSVTTDTKSSTNTSTKNNRNIKLITGIITGAALGYLLTNKKWQHGMSSVAGSTWGTMKGEVEELKEQLADLQAELEYYRQQSDNNRST